MVPVNGTIDGVDERGRRPSPEMLLETVAAEIEDFVGASGWDRAPVLFALVPTRALAADPGAAAFLGEVAAAPDEIADTALTPIAQDELPDGPLDEALAQIGWPPEVVGCALSQEILMLPPSAEAALAEAALDSSATPAAAAVASHPERREARLVVAVLRDGTSAGVLRLRGAASVDEDGRPMAGPSEDELLTGTELAPNLVRALAETLAD